MSIRVTQPVGTPQEIADAVRACFHPGVAYMPVPRCDQCRFWREPEGVFSNIEDGWKDCGKAVWAEDETTKMRFDPQGWDCDGGQVMTRADFGCVQFEKK